MRGVQIWRSGSGQSHAEDFGAPIVGCLCYQALCESHFGEIVSSHATISEAISLAKELNDTSALALALWHAGWLAYFDRNPAEVERLASELMELSTRQNFVNFVPLGGALRGWACSVSDDTAKGIENSFSAAIRIAREQKSISLQKRAEATYAEYRRQKASMPGGRGFRLPL